MSAPDTILTTERLTLRSWRESDLDHLVEMGQNPDVMRFFPGLMSRDECRTMLGRLMKREAETGLTFWATERKNDGAFLGFVGITHVPFESHFTPNVEVGWRFLPHSWGHGYATEGAAASLAHGFETCGFDEIVAMAVPGNVKSHAVMERLGMTRSPADDFDHPLIERGHPLERHILYRLTAKDWRQARTT